jgi:hypothetical protein
MDATNFFNALWQQYIAKTPQAELIHKSLIDQGERVVNDHVAFRTLKSSKIGIAACEPVLAQLGYLPAGEYRFEDKHLYAKSYEHQDSASSHPKIFLSELLIDEFESPVVERLNALLRQIPSDFEITPDFFYSGLPWQMPSWQDYLVLADVSEYAGWLSINGMCANHFTINVNSLETIKTLNDLLEVIRALGLPLNETGGVIKGTPEVGLTQASTLADEQTFTFSCGHSALVKTCFYEFAERHPVAGKIYQGFVTANADKIFHSTDR